MFTWDNVKGPSEVKRYAFDWSAELGSGDVITSCSAAPVDGFDGGLTITQDDQFDGKLSYVKVSGGDPGKTARIQGSIVINNGDQVFTEVGCLVIANATDPAASSLQDLRADLIELRKARVSILTGTQVKEVWREGRRLLFNVGSVADVTKAIHEYESQIALAETQLAAGKTSGRFRALKPRFG